MKITYSLFIVTILFACKKFDNTENQTVRHIGAMKNVMWKGELGPVVTLDTLDSQNLYAIGPLAYLQGEILVFDGIFYSAQMAEDSSIAIHKNSSISAPFLVYAQVDNWIESELPSTIQTSSELEEYLIALKREQAFTFKLTGRIAEANIHLQNLAPGSNVSSPEEAHRGQVNYSLPAQSVSILGFYAEDAQGIYTHHDSFIHMHLISEDEKSMGHVDSLVFEEMKIWISK